MQKKKKILYTITKGNFGGAQRYVYDLATSLPKDKYDIVVACGPTIATSFAQDYGESKKAMAGKEGLKEKLEEKEVRVIELTSSQRNINISKDIKTFFDLWKIIRKEKPDILHTNSSKIGGLGALAGRIAKTPRIIFTSHGWAFNEERSFLSKTLILFLHWFTVLLSHQTIAVSNETKNNIAWMPFIKNKIKVIHNGVEDFEKVGGVEARNILAPNNTDKIIIYSISELHKNKGIDIALKSLTILEEEIRNKIIYCIAGSGEEEENLKNLVQKLDLENQVKFLGFVPDAKKILSGADIFLFPSRVENLPLAILEAGLTELPIITTNVGGIVEIVKDMENGILIHKNNPKEIAEAIVYLLEHKDKQKEFGEAVKQTVTNFFSLDKMLQKTITLYS